MNAQIDIERQAAEWIIRRDRGEESAAERAAFENWLAADARHRKAYLALQEPWQRADGLKSWRPYARVLDARVLKRYAAPARHASRMRYAIAASIVLATAVAALFMLHRSMAPFVYTTEVGGYERVILRDGSTLQLNTDTQVRVDYTAGSRQIRLVRGEAYFTVARDNSRPFEVLAADVAVRALGTSFTVRMRNADAVEVLVTEGRVTLLSGAVASHSKATGGSLPTLQAGEAALAEPRGIVVRRLPHGEATRRLSWQGGELSFKGETLDQVIAEFNRYNRRKLEIGDPQLAALQVGGNFQATDLVSFTEALERSFDLRVDENENVIRLSRREAR
jgi:transmembrane sensor